MIYLLTFLYYFCFASSVMVYGIGLNKITDVEIDTLSSVVYLGKLLASIFLSVLFSWLIISSVLIPLHLIEFYPIICFLIFVCINTFMEALVRLTSGVSTSEFILSYLVIIFSVAESTSLLDAIIISGSCLFAYAFLVPFISAFRKRVELDGSSREMYYCRIFFFFSVLLFVIYSWNVAWINPEVGR